MDKIAGMNKSLFLDLAFCMAFEKEFNQDLYNLMNNLEYNDENYCDFQDVINDKEIEKKLSEYADKIRNIIRNLD